MFQIQRDGDYTINDADELPLTLTKSLGSGLSGVVEKVQDRNTGRVFARKKMMISGKRAKETAHRIYENEIKVLRRLKEHHHVIRVFATYIAKREIGILLEPVADGGDLTHFLDHVDEVQTKNAHDPHLGELRGVLRRAFGCLAGGLAFMHQKRVRHKDIKPRNILVHQGSMLYTDFGYSLDCSQSSNSTTGGQPDSLTRQYSAPEVLQNGERNTSSDVYSLGCVYLEILAVLIQQPSLASQEEPFAHHLDSIHDQLRAVQAGTILAQVLAEMTANDRNHRPKAIDVTHRLMPLPGYHCGPCKKMGGPTTTQSATPISHPKITLGPDTFFSAFKALQAFVLGRVTWDNKYDSYMFYSWDLENCRYYRQLYKSKFIDSSEKHNIENIVDGLWSFLDWAHTTCKAPGEGVRSAIKNGFITYTSDERDVLDATRDLWNSFNRTPPPNERFHTEYVTFTIHEMLSFGIRGSHFHQDQPVRETRLLSTGMDRMLSLDAPSRIMVERMEQNRNSMLTPVLGRQKAMTADCIRQRFQ